MSDALEARDAGQPSDVVGLLVGLGFDWTEPGYWSLRADRGIELALEPQLLNAGAYKLQVYIGRLPLVDGEVLVDVKPRPGR